MSLEKRHKRFFDKQAPTWHHKIDEPSRIRLRSIFMKKIPDLQAPVLDIGSGTGVLLPELQNNVLKKYLIVEADFSSIMLQENRRLNGIQPAIHYVQTDAHHLPFKRGGFNSIVCFAAYAHFADKQRVIEEFSEILNPGGKLVILHLMCHYRLNKMHQSMGDAVAYDELPSVDELSSLLGSVGFTVLHGEEDKNIFLISAHR